MTLLFIIAILAGFGLWFASALPGSRVPEWSGRACFLLAAILWAVSSVQ